MAYEIPGFGHSLRADVDMSAIATWQFSAVWLNVATAQGAGTGNGLAVISGQGALTTPPLGVLQNNPQQGEAGEVMITGITKVIYGATIALGTLLAANSAGALVPAATGTWCIGQALESGTAGDIATMLFRGPYKLP